jgi:hypothetical protein
LVITPLRSRTQSRCCNTTATALVRPSSSIKKFPPYLWLGIRQPLVSE